MLNTVLLFHQFRNKHLSNPQWRLVGVRLAAGENPSLLVYGILPSSWPLTHQLIFLTVAEAVWLKAQHFSLIVKGRLLGFFVLLSTEVASQSWSGSCKPRQWFHLCTSAHKSMSTMHNFQRKLSTSVPGNVFMIVKKTWPSYQLQPNFHPWLEQYVFFVCFFSNVVYCQPNDRLALMFSHHTGCEPYS